MGKKTDKSSPRRRRQRELTAQEIAVWEEVVSAAKPLGRPNPKPSPQKPTSSPNPPLSEKIAPTPKSAHFLGMPGAARALGDYAGIDRRTADRMQRGKRRIDATLDLHGMNLQAAHIALQPFIEKNYHRQARMLLVITGKGQRGGRIGALRAALPGWLGEPTLARYVLAFDMAQPKDGGAGAFYILLRRRR